MNCRAGDLALIIRGFPQHLGKLVTCVELVPVGTIVNTHSGPAFLRCDCPIWRIDRPLAYVMTNGVTAEAPFAADNALQPIRPERDEDLEMVQSNSDITCLNRPVWR